MGIDRMHDYMTRFGLGQRVSLDMFEETAGLMPSRGVEAGALSPGLVSG